MQTDVADIYSHLLSWLLLLAIWLFLSLLVRNIYRTKYYICHRYGFITVTYCPPHLHRRFYYQSSSPKYFRIYEAMRRPPAPAFPHLAHRIKKGKGGRIIYLNYNAHNRCRRKWTED
ncbi:hypothetical protein BJX62DRAFT_188607 [Aspergillus germanicus]